MPNKREAAKSESATEGSKEKYACTHKDGSAESKDTSSPGKSDFIVLKNGAPYNNRYGYDKFFVQGDLSPPTRKSQSECLESTKYKEMVKCLCKAGEVHRRARQNLSPHIRVGANIWDLCCRLEDEVRRLVNERGPDAGMGFPTGISRNHCVAHYTPNPGDTHTTLEYGDVTKIDFGVQVGGYIVDSAFTVTFDGMFDELVEATQVATDTAISESGVDSRVCDIGEIIQEVIESYEVQMFGMCKPLHPVQGISGHSIEKHLIHGAKVIPLFKDDTSKDVLEEGEIYAIETFATTGESGIVSSGETSHYALSKAFSNAKSSCAESQPLLEHIQKTFKTLPFCRRWLSRPDGGSSFVNGNTCNWSNSEHLLNNLVGEGVVEAYPPLYVSPGDYTSQFEHTFLLTEKSKIVFSKGDDY